MTEVAQAPGSSTTTETAELESFRTDCFEFLEYFGVTEPERSCADFPNLGPFELEPDRWTLRCILARCPTFAAAVLAAEYELSGADGSPERALEHLPLRSSLVENIIKYEAPLLYEPLLDAICNRAVLSTRPNDRDWTLVGGIPSGLNVGKLTWRTGVFHGIEDVTNAEKNGRSYLYVTQDRAMEEIITALKRDYGEDIQFHGTGAEKVDDFVDNGVRRAAGHVTNELSWREAFYTTVCWREAARRGWKRSNETALMLFRPAAGDLATYRFPETREGRALLRQLVHATANRDRSAYDSLPTEFHDASVIAARTCQKVVGVAPGQITFGHATQFAYRDNAAEKAISDAMLPVTILVDFHPGPSRTDRSF